MTQVIYGLNDPPVKLCELDLSGIPSDALGLSFFNLSGYAIIAAYQGSNDNFYLGAWSIKSGKFILSGGYQEVPGESSFPGFTSICTYGPDEFEYWPGLFGTRLFFVEIGSISKYLMPKPSPIFNTVLQILLGDFAKLVNLLSAITQSANLVPVSILNETFTGVIPSGTEAFGNGVELFSTISNYADNYAAFFNIEGQYYFLNKNGVVSITSTGTPNQYQDDTGLYVYGTPNETDGQVTQIVNGEIVKQFTNPDIFGQNYYGNANNILVFINEGTISLYDINGNSYPTTGLPDLDLGGTFVGAGSGLIFFSDHNPYYPFDRNIIITKYAFVDGTWVKGGSTTPIFVPAFSQAQMLYLRDGSSLLAIGSNENTPYFMSIYLLAGPYTPYTLPVIGGVNLHLNPLCPPCTDEEIF